MRYGGINYYYLYYIIYYYVKFIMRIHKHSYSAQQFLDQSNVLSTMGTEATILSTVGDCFNNCAIRTATKLKQICK